LSVLPEVGKGSINAGKGLLERARERIRRIGQGGRAGAEDPQVELGEEESDVEAEGGDEVAGRVRDALEEAFEPEAPEVVAHGTARVGGQVPAEEGRDHRSQIAVAEASGQVGEMTQPLEEGHHAGIPEAQGRSTLAGFDSRLLQAIQPVLVDHARVTGPLGVEEPLVDGVTDGAELSETGQTFPHGEVGRVIDGRFGAERPLFFEVLLDVGVFVLDL